LKRRLLDATPGGKLFVRFYALASLEFINQLLPEPAAFSLSHARTLFERHSLGQNVQNRTVSAPVQTGRKERMKEFYTEGVANHGDPELCADARKVTGEALTGVHTGRVLSHEIRAFGTPTLLTEAEGNMDNTAIARCRSVPRGRRPLACVEPFCVGTGRSPDCPPWMAWRAASGRPVAARR
jgi:hypothetical protein